MTERLTGKVALISGAARGMGAAHARAMVEQGARVVVADVLDDAGRDVADALGEAGHYVHLDVTEPDQWDGAVTETLTRFGHLDVLVNNAGILNFGFFEDYAVAEWKRSIDVNLTGVFLGIRAVVTPMKDHGGGSIINVSSIEGLAGTMASHGYTASKFGVRGLTKSAALELGPADIRVNSIHPGLIRTPMIEGLPEDIFQSALGRAAEPEEVSRLVVYLASDESSYSTGSEFVVDGGVTAGAQRFLVGRCTRPRMRGAHPRWTSATHRTPSPPHERSHPSCGGSREHFPARTRCTAATESSDARWTCWAQRPHCPTSSRPRSTPTSPCACTGRPTCPVKPPTLLWIHGGGTLMGTAAQDDKYCRRMAHLSGIAVASVEHRLAPEHPYPTPVEDCYAALTWLARQPWVDPNHLAVGGASAGGHFAAALAQRAHDRSEVRLAAQLLVYPQLHDTTGAPPDGRRRFIWNERDNQLAWAWYLNGADPAAAAPARRTDLTGLPPAWIGVGTLDLFHTECVDYARRLRDAGVDVQEEFVAGAFHIFDQLVPNATISAAFQASQIHFLQRKLVSTS